MGWEKVLYKDQGVADNYTDDTFLDEMKKNGMFDFFQIVYPNVYSECLFGIFILFSL